MIACPVKWDPACWDISRGIELRMIEFDQLTFDFQLLTFDSLLPCEIRCAYFTGLAPRYLFQ